MARERIYQKFGLIFLLAAEKKISCGVIMKEDTLELFGSYAPIGQVVRLSPLELLIFAADRTYSVESRLFEKADGATAVRSLLIKIKIPNKLINLRL